MNVASCMTPDPLVVAPNVTLSAALQLMDDCAIRHLPVVDGERLVGVVSDRDLLGATGGAILGGSTPRRGSDPVSEVMQRSFVTVGEDESVLAATVEVIVRGIGCLPVVDAGRLTGILTEMDLLALYARTCKAQGLEAPDNPTVDTVTPQDAFVATPEATLGQLEEACLAKGVRHFPIAHEGELRGIVSDRDLRRARGAGLPASTAVEQVMTPRVQTVAPTARLSEAAALMHEHRISSLAVVDEEGIRIVTSTDVLDQATSVLREPAA